MLPPISLVAAVAAAVPLFVRRARERSRRNVVAEEVAGRGDVWF
jgi:hypothetical protein